MKSQITNLEITGISNLGQGFAVAQNHKKIFVSKTLPGDQIEAKILKENSKFIAADLLKIVSFSSNRRAAPCKYFSECGGCELQHLQENYYYNFKQKILSDLLKQNQINVEKVSWNFIGEKSRRRAVFQVDINGRLGFFREESNDVVKIDNCVVLEKELSNLIPLFPIHKKIHQVSVANFDNGVAVIFHLHSQPDLEFTENLTAFAKQNKVISLGYKIDNDYTLIYQSQTPQLFFDKIKIDLTPDIFLQATRQGQKIIIDTINKNFCYSNFLSCHPSFHGNKKNENVGDDINSVVDLYCGVGTYSFGIFQNHSVKINAFEGSKKMIDLLNKNAAKNNLNLKGFTRDLVKNPLKINELQNYQAAIINPPRNGAKAQIENLAKSKILNIIYVSCNPQAFINDAKILLQNGYKISEIIAIDQFCYSHHIELVAMFVNSGN